VSTRRNCSERLKRAQDFASVEESDGLAVGMLFKDIQDDWTFAGLMEGVQGQTAFHSIKQLENLLQGFSYPISEDWDDGIDKASKNSGPQTAKCVGRH